MNQPSNLSSSNASMDPLDLAEAYRSFRRARLFLFCLLVVGLILTQSAFWVVASGGIDELLEPGNTVFVDGQSNDASMTFTRFVEVAEEPDDSLIKAELLNIILRDGLLTTNYVLFLSAILYSLMLLTTLHLSLTGRMGGVTAACKAFFLSLIALMLLVPWQLMVGIFPGTIYTFSELIERVQDRRGSSLADWDTIRFYIRFSGLWLITICCLIQAQRKSSKSKKQIQDRLKQNTPGPAPMGTPTATPPTKPITIAVADIGDTK